MLAIYLLLSLVACLVLAAYLELLDFQSKLNQRLIILLSLVLFTSVFFIPNVSIWLTNIAVIMSAGTISFLLAKGISGKAPLIAFLVTASLIDILSFSNGLTRSIITLAQSGNPHLLSMLTISFSNQGVTSFVLGLGDLIIFAVVFLSLRKLGLEKFRAFFAPFLGLAIAIVWGVQVGGLSAIPVIAASSLTTLLLEKNSQIN